LDSEGDEVEVVKVNETNVVLRTGEQGLIVADIDEVIMDLEAGDLVSMEAA
jgi:hypothetical protein